MIYFGTRLSDNISRREPEGYLICLNVPVARTGIQEYLPEELGLPPARSLIPVHRPAEEVFSPACMASFEGMPVTDEHPSFAEGVNKDNIRYLQKGHAHNIRRGEGKESDLLLADRQLARAMSQGMSAMIAVNKSDLDGGALAEELRAEYRPAGIPVIAVSAATGLGLQELRGQMEGALCCLSGQSGVGKSSLLNRMLGLALETGDISERIARGKNTTRHVELLRSGGLRVMDTAGFSLLEPERDLMPERLRERWPEFLPYEGKCRFNECLHDREPGCAVAEAVKNGNISPYRYSRYKKFYEELQSVRRY